MEVKDSVALVTGANRGMGKIFVQELLRRGAKKVYATARNLDALTELTKDERVVALKLDVTVDAEVIAVAARAKDVNLLINNAGAAVWQGALSASDIRGARTEMEVNYFGVLAMSRAFAPILKKNGGGVIVNVLTMLSLVTLPLAGTYSASKAAALALTRSLRAELMAQGTAVIGTLPVQVDTEMGQPMPEPRLKPEEVVADTLNGVEQGAEDVYPGELSLNVAEAFSADPKAVQAQLSTMLPTAH